MLGSRATAGAARSPPLMPSAGRFEWGDQTRQDNGIGKADIDQPRTVLDL
jgi:hypothetical protein